MLMQTSLISTYCHIARKGFAAQVENDISFIVDKNIILKQ